MKDSKKTERSFFDIDTTDLDREWVDQPRLYHEHALLVAAAQRRYDQEKTDLELLAAEKDAEIRSDPASFGVTKVTEVVVERTILISRKYQAQLEAMHNARHDLNVARAALDALDHRKKALENLVSLFLADYFAAPRARGDAREKMERNDTNEVFGKNKRTHRAP